MQPHSTPGQLAAQPTIATATDSCPTPPYSCRSYRARRRSDGREVALKVTDVARLTPWSRRAALREAHVLAALPHPCLTSYHEAFALGSRLCVATEAARGGDLRQLLE